jgi:hypothetical protein
MDLYYLQKISKTLFVKVVPAKYQAMKMYEVMQI